MSLPVPSTGKTGYNYHVDPRELAEMEAPLIALANRSGGDLRKLLYAFFSFLHRRTDFYMVHPTVSMDDTDNNNDSSVDTSGLSMGFREGDAEKMLLAAFRQFPLRRIPMPSSSPQKNKSSSPQKVAPTTTVSSSSSKATSATMEQSTATSSTSSTSSTTATGTASSDIKETTAATTTTTEAAASKQEKVRYTEEGLQIPIGNGGITDRYTWTQTLEECTVVIGSGSGSSGAGAGGASSSSNNGTATAGAVVLLPQNCRAKDLQVNITPTSLSIAHKPTTTVLLEGTLAGKVVPSESTWTLEDDTNNNNSTNGRVLVIVLYKHTKTFWKTVLEGDDEIDTSLVDSRRHIDEYDDSTQAQIRKIMFDQNQMRKGLPTSDELSGTTTVTTSPNKPPSIPSSIPPLPPGVEYIDQTILDEKTIKTSAPKPKQS